SHRSLRGIWQRAPAALGDRHHATPRGAAGSWSRDRRSLAGVTRRACARSVVGRHKAIVRREGTFLYDVVRDPDELAPEAASLPAFPRRARRDGLPPAAVAPAAAPLERWGPSVAAA